MPPLDSTAADASLATLIGRRWVAAAGASFAGFAFVLYGLTTLQDRVSGIAAQGIGMLRG